ncbi:DUF6291 domain-containing protein [Bacteroides cellulosilyticus]|jgi:hypothetical protein|uniref:DUF6291 domain-containing protein n=1 Tax=Bacteroides cellulosilyticus TaxID=246787 RepID=UPI00189C6F3E|nr:DUF6291 domain-containing protein [Bacteroides cellulosilyticus]DAU32352.1 MAG TPA: hypothetical protein [Caudoviricetes sp.]
MRESFVFYRSFYDAIKDLPRDVQGEIYTAIMEYSLYGKETENLKPIARSVFTLMKPQIDVNNKRFENGKRGGRPKSEDKPKGNQNETKDEPKNNQKITKDEPNVNVNDNVNVYTENTTNVVSKKDAAKAATLKRKEEFRASLSEFENNYHASTLSAFFNYWSELNKSGTKMLFEMKPTWELSKRLATWASRERTQRPNTDTGTVLLDNSQSKYNETLW